MSNAEHFTAAACLLVEIAGPAPHHIEMSKTGPKKYYSVARALTEADASAHLRGVKTKGALCSRPDGLARALAYDADDSEHWQALEQAARKLAAAGYRPLLEPSPRGRGGHLWLIYSTLVDAQAARNYAHSIAPELESIAEYWPGPSGGAGWNRVRLPGGRYVAPGFSAWCGLYDSQGQELARDGASAARTLLDYQASAELVSSAPPTADPSRDRDPNSAVTPPAPAHGRDHDPHVTFPIVPNRNASPLRNEPAQANRFLWFHYSAAQLAQWFNERHTLEELHPTERGGMAFSPSVSERTPSTGYFDTAQGERWTDFSSNARRAGGQPDGGDALELYIRLQGRSRGSVLSELGRELVREARWELEATARSGVQPPAWVVEIMTPAGWEHYDHLAAQAQQGDEECGK